MPSVYLFWIKWRSSIVVGAAIVCGGIMQAVFEAKGDENPADPYRWWWLVGAIAAGVVATIAVPVFSHLDGVREVRALRRYQLQINDSLTPALQLLVQLSEAPNVDRRRDLFQRLLQTCLNAARHGSGQRRVRASYYRAYVAEGSKKQRLEPESSLGRNVTASSVFEKGTKKGNQVWKQLEENQTRFEPDTAKIDPEEMRGWDPKKKRDYKTFISVPVRGEEQIYGMLTVDAPNPGELSEYDEMYVRCVGLLLGSGIAQVVKS